MLQTALSLVAHVLGVPGSSYSLILFGSVGPGPGNPDKWSDQALTGGGGGALSRGPTVSPGSQGKRSRLDLGEGSKQIENTDFNFCLLSSGSFPGLLQSVIQGVVDREPAAWGKGWGWQRQEGCFHPQSIAPLVLDLFPEAK